MVLLASEVGELLDAREEEQHGAVVARAEEEVDGAKAAGQAARDPSGRSSGGNAGRDSTLWSPQRHKPLIPLTSCSSKRCPQWSSRIQAYNAGKRRRQRLQIRPLVWYVGGLNSETPVTGNHYHRSSLGTGDMLQLKSADLRRLKSVLASAEEEADGAKARTQATKPCDSQVILVGDEEAGATEDAPRSEKR